MVPELLYSIELAGQTLSVGITLTPPNVGDAITIGDNCYVVTDRLWQVRGEGLEHVTIIVDDV